MVLESFYKSIIHITQQNCPANGQLTFRFLHLFLLFMFITYLTMGMHIRISSPSSRLVLILLFGAHCRYPSTRVMVSGK